MSRWADVPEPPPSRGVVATRRWPAVVVPTAIALLLLLAGRPVVAGVVVVVVLALQVVTRLRPAWGARLDRVLATVGQRAANAVSWLLLALVEVLVLTPVSAVARLTRSDPLVGGGQDGTRWQPRPQRRSARRTFGPDHRTAVARTPARRVVAAVPRLVGWIVLLGVANYAVGWAWDEVVGSHDDPGPIPRATVSELADAVAFADDAWADAYWAEYEDLQFDPVPFLLTRVRDVTGQDITSAGGVRRSYEPAPGEVPEIWFLGGGAAWGEGQRDLHTIPSEIARLSEEAGRPVRVVNLAQPGHTTWQAALLLEQALAERPRPALAIVYGGADDVGAQLDSPSGAPTHYNVEGLRVALGGRDSAADQARDLWEDYRETSLLTRVARGLVGVLGAQPAHAAEGELAARIEDLRRRSDAVAQDVGEDHGVPVLQVWQAATGVRGDDGAYREAVVAADDLDLRGVLDDVADEVYADGVVTDEVGARLVAEALWAEVAERL